MKKKIKIDKQQMIIVGTVLGLLLLIGTTFAFFDAASSGEGIFGIRITTDTVDYIAFEVGEDISITANQKNFAQGMEDRTGSSFAEAIVKANSATNHYTTNYNLFFVIDINEFHYTTKEKKAELVLTIKDPNGNIVENIPGLKKVYDSNNVVMGLDITEAKGSFAIAQNHLIETTSEKTEKWDIEVRLVNLDTNQYYNAGKTFSGNVHITQENMEIYRVPEVNTLNVINNDNGVELTVGAEATTHTSDIRYYYYGIKESTSKRSLKFYSSDLTINDIDYVRSEEARYTFKGLKPSTEYDIYAFTEDINGFTSEIYNDTLTTSKYDLPKINNVTAADIKEREFTLNVEAVPGKVGTIDKYYYLCDVDKEAEPYTYVESTSSSYKCNVSEDEKTYKTKVYVKDSNGYLSVVYDKEVTTLPRKDVQVAVNNLPTNILGNYKATLSSSSGVGTYDARRGLIISSLTGEGSFNLTYNTSNTKLVDKIISLNNTTQGEGQVVNEPSTDYRYEGKNPNNYVWFNNELWRIIGVFGENTHGQNGNLVKIIRENPIGGLAWDKLNSNNWATSSLNELLNTSYYNATDGTNSESCSGTSNCDYTQKGIQDNYRGMIQQVIWMLGGISTHDATAAEFYSTERGTIVPSGASATYNGYIGLMYPSDYGYSALSTICERTTYLNYYNSSSCAGQSWIFNQTYEWLLSPNVGRFGVNINSSGRVWTDYWDLSTGLGFDIRPVLYLKSSTYITGGEGTETNPYTIEMH